VAAAERHRGPQLALHRNLVQLARGGQGVVQQAFLAPMTSSCAAKVRALRPWPYGIARHRCLTVLRARRPSSVDHAPARASDELVAELARREEFRAVLPDVAWLLEDQRVAFVHAQIGDVSYPAGRLGTSDRVLVCTREPRPDALAEPVPRDRGAGAGAVGSRFCVETRSRARHVRVRSRRFR
jgi:hypothetical protein